MMSNNFDVIIVGGSYSGLAAGMALGRALRNVLIIDSRKPCNRQTPHSHNFLTQDGKTPTEIAILGRQQVSMYKTVTFLNDLAIKGVKSKQGFDIQVAAGDIYTAKKVIFATGIHDLLPDIPGFSDCWGISVIHCPYCHGYEVRNQKTGILANGDFAFDFSRLISNWTKKITVFTNGSSTLSTEQASLLSSHKIDINEKALVKVIHTNGQLEKLVFEDVTEYPLQALYAPAPFVQHCDMPQTLGCELSVDGYVIVDAFQETTVSGIYACGDNAVKMRTVANAVATGTTAGMSASKKLIIEEY